VVEIEIEGLPADRSDYATLQVHFSEQALPEACDAWRNHYVAYPVDVFENFSASLDATPGATLHLRLCIADAAGNVTGELTAQAVASEVHRIFVSSERFTGDLDEAFTEAGDDYATGLEGADARCEALAHRAGLGGRWKAVLSDGSVAASERLSITAPVYNLALMNESEVAKDAEAFWSASLTELGDLVAFTETGLGVGFGEDRLAWTGSLEDGSPHPETCSD
jgi:hypothetical protein